MSYMDDLNQILGLKPPNHAGTGNLLPVRNIFFDIDGCHFVTACFAINSRKVEVIHEEYVEDEEVKNIIRTGYVPEDKALTPASLLAAFGEAVLEHDEAIIARILDSDLPYVMRIAIANAYERQADAIDAQAKVLSDKAAALRSLSIAQYLHG